MLRFASNAIQKSLSSLHPIASTIQSVQCILSYSSLLIPMKHNHAQSTISLNRLFSSASSPSSSASSSLLKQFAPKTVPTIAPIDSQSLASRDSPLDPKNPYANQIATPTDIRLKKAERALYIRYSDGREFRYPAEYLRVESPSAEVQGHGPLGFKKLIHGRSNVAITSIEPVGHYAIRIIFSDGHDSGIYSWKYLLELGQTKFTRIRQYIRDLNANNLSRHPRVRKTASGVATG